MICPDFATPQYLFFAKGVSPLVYYSHFSSIVISLLVGFFVYLKDRKKLLNKLLFSIAITFFVWTLLSLITWTNNNSSIIMLDWSFDGAVYILLCLLVLYFFYVFIDGKDVAISKKITFLTLLVPVVILTPTRLNLSGFSIVSCGANENHYFTNYYYGVGFFVFVWVLFLAISRYRKAESSSKRQLLIMSIWVEFFLLAFFTK